ncbi:GrpB family protein [Sporolactobacillus kofuensis]|uniref:GrpB family protein n=1 Tax=Sporolactobacillus kofuensis TaxID=269672 RepID=A0ABW1WID1_9BACL|nr:GrpB family protein [Sporolactobacillus kofuensis]
MQRERKVVPYDEEWPILYKKESSQIIHHLKSMVTAIHHIGSTAIPGMCAKPTIDILIEVEDVHALDDNEQLSSLGYRPLGTHGIKGRRYFEKTDGVGNHLVHLHAYTSGTEDVVRHLAFRDFLSVHEDAADLYSQMKVQLAEHYPNDCDSYCEGKNELCRRIEQTALQWWYGA